MKLAVVVLSLLLLLQQQQQTVQGFVSPVSHVSASQGINRAVGVPQMMDVSSSSSAMMDAMASLNTIVPLEPSSSVAPLMLENSNLLAFADQGQNLAGIFFQASLLPYLLFLYFLSFRGNRIPALGNFGFQFVLLFVMATIPSGIISKVTYGTSLANVDWLHGGAEALLTTANIMLVLGFKEGSQTMSEESKVPLNLSRGLAFGACALFAAACAYGPGLGGFEAHSPFLFGLGDLSPDAILSLPWVQHSEPENALSIPTWAIHFSSVFEFLVAMQLVWEFSKVAENEKWKGLTWGMLPLHASGICACTYHFFYNASSLQFLVTLQAAFTCLGNVTCAAAAYRIAASNGWTLRDANPFPRSSTSPAGLAVDQAAAAPLAAEPEAESSLLLAARVAALTVAASYAMKYGELGLDLPFTPDPAAGLGLVLGIPAITAAAYLKDSEGVFSFQLPGGGGGGSPGLSMADVKKYGLSGTVAYVLTEVAFWAVAFPAASAALYQATGHWPDVLGDAADRATVLAFVFAGANAARLLVPLRLGAALALAPWVDENILSRDATGSE